MQVRKILFVQLPIPPAGPIPIVGNVPLAAGYLILWARRCGLDKFFEFEILPTNFANYGSDEALADEILARRPWMVALTCYLWNIDRSLWLVARLKARAPELQVTIGGPEITADNQWVLESPAVDYAVIGEGEQTFAELLERLVKSSDISGQVDGLWRRSAPVKPLFRKPLANIDLVSSPYLEGILDAADEQMLMLETIRGCVFKCKFCYYPKSYDSLYFLSQEKIIANLRHARQRGAREIVLLDPTLNQRKDFDDFLRLLALENSDRQCTYFGELRAEGIKSETAKLLRQANFTEVEIGLQSINPNAQLLMNRRNNLKSFEKGVEAMMDAGIRVKVDLIIGLPGDTVDSVRRGFDYLASSQLYSTVQVFNLAILPGTAFRHEALELGLSFQPRPPYYVLETPTLSMENLYDLMSEAEDVFHSEWDPFPEPRLNFDNGYDKHLVPVVNIDLDRFDPNDSKCFFHEQLPPANRRTQAFTVWIRGKLFNNCRDAMIRVLRQLLTDCPHTTVQVIVEPTGNPLAIVPDLPEELLGVCYQQPSYLDRYYSLNPSGMLGSKRVLILLDAKIRSTIDSVWLDAVGQSATIVWRGGTIADAELASFELCAPM